MAILAALLTIIRALSITQAVVALNGWVSGLGIWGPVVLARVYIVATVLFVPGTILTLAGGALFGLGVGTLTVSVGSTVGASLAFLIARYAARRKVAAMAQGNRRFGAIDRAIGEGGWKIVALLRMSPAIPFNLQNYLYGLTPIRFWPYVHRHATWFEFDAQADVVRLTKLYNWFGNDFEQVAGSVLQFAARYSPELKRALANDAAPRIEWLPYDWKLNSVQNNQPR